MTTEKTQIIFETSQLMPVPQAAEILGVHFTTLYRQIASKKLRVVRIGKQIFLETELVKEMAKRVQP